MRYLYFKLYFVVCIISLDKLHVVGEGADMAKKSGLLSFVNFKVKIIKILTDHQYVFIRFHLIKVSAIEGIINCYQVVRSQVQKDTKHPVYS